MASAKNKPRYQKIDGILFPEMFSPKCIQESLEYKPKDGEIIIDTYPKCGTTWMQNVVIQILRKGQPLETSADFFKASPFLEMMGEDGVRRMSRPGVIKTHLPYDKMPYSKAAKYIFVVRNPLDTCVSFYYHTCTKPGFQFWNATFDDFFELFMTGQVEFNDYFDHLLSWYPHKKDPNVYHTTFEKMKTDLRTVVLEVSGFLGKEYLDAVEKDKNVMNDILSHSEFAYMKRKFAKVYDVRDLPKSEDVPKGLGYMRDYIASIDIPDDLPDVQHVRKGLVGGWKDYFTNEQLAKLKDRYETKLAGSDVHQLWPNLFEIK